MTPPCRSRPLGRVPAYLDGVLAQPATLRRSAEVVRRALAGPAGSAARAALAGGGSTLAGPVSIDVVGSGVGTASAGAAALLLREAAHVPAAAYATREYHTKLPP